MTLEELLNKLIEKGWKPFWITCTDFIKGTGLEWIPSYCFNPQPHMWVAWWTRKYHRPSLRQIVSKESWLWQFCVENKLINQDKGNVQKWTHQFRHCVYDEDCWIENNNLYNDNYEYRIIESSLKDENELEDFLLSNIKVEWQQ